MQKKLHELAITDLTKGSHSCNCGKLHHSDVEEVVVERGALRLVPDQVRKQGGSKVFIIADRTTYAVAGKAVCSFLREAQIEYTCHIFHSEKVKPDSDAVGEAILNFDSSCDLIMGVGSGTICDIGKIIANATGLKYIVVGTAPSMDGFASDNSSMILYGAKVSIKSSTPTAIIADLDVLREAPAEMVQAGLGDMIAKFISVCEWRISHVINGEYFCDEVASLIRRSVNGCIRSIDGLRRREDEALELLFESLVLAGIAVSFAGVSRPVSGIEHYFSHIWDMRALEFHTEKHLHGIQCGIGTILALRVYEMLREITPEKQRALDYVGRFSGDDWNSHLRQFLGSCAEELIEKEKQQGKYDKEKHRSRFDQIALNWDKVQQIIREELPGEQELLDVLSRLDFPSDPKQLGLSPDIVRDTFMVTKDMRNKYVASHLVWDLGVIEEVTGKLC